MRRVHCLAEPERSNREDPRILPAVVSNRRALLSLLPGRSVLPFFFIIPPPPSSFLFFFFFFLPSHLFFFFLFSLTHSHPPIWFSAAAQSDSHLSSLSPPTLPRATLSPPSSTSRCQSVPSHGPHPCWPGRSCVRCLR